MSSADSYWIATYQWEEDYSSDWESWDDDGRVRSHLAEAAKLLESDPHFALDRYKLLAEDGSAFAMRWAGILYRGSHGIEENIELAEDYLQRAISAGSWLSTINYANLLYEQGAHEDWQDVLDDGLEKGFVPAFFWHAWNTYRLNPSASTAQAVRPNMLRAAEAGHPGARAMLARWTARGRFGLRKVPAGLKMLWRIFDEFISSEEAT